MSIETITPISLTDEQILKLADEIQKERERAELAKVIRQVYGEEAAKCEIYSGTHYNDEYDEDTISSIRVYDAEGRELTMRRTEEAWETVLDDYRLYRLSDYNYDTLSYYLGQYLFKHDGVSIPTGSDGDSFRSTYNFNALVTRSFTQVMGTPVPPSEMPAVLVEEDVYVDDEEDDDDQDEEEEERQREQAAEAALAYREDAYSEYPEDELPYGTDAYMDEPF